ncbi:MULTISPECIES: TIGR02569 family protein [unclassified Corynebacterium]|uniref:TIGR02569 family protein n=1 Tax=unclassified Corynebacterium TaxID=2624378 RepID=UPI00352483EA
MDNTHPELPDYVCGIFRASGPAPQPVGPAWDNGWRVGQTVISRVLDPVAASWSAKVREHLRPDGVRPARPVRSTDGRYVVSGWRATTFLEGELLARVDETVAAALRLADALAELPVAEHLTAPVGTPDGVTDLFAIADRAAWSPDPAAVLAPALGLDSTASETQRAGMTMAALVSRTLEPVGGVRQVGHADMFATTLYSGSLPPVVTDIVGVAHPHGYTAAQVIVDALVAGAVDDGIIARYSHLPDIGQLMRRALLYRLYLHALLDDADPNVSAKLARVVDLLLSGVSDRL